jgi:hypothetical protein
MLTIFIQLCKSVYDTILGIDRSAKSTFLLEPLEYYAKTDGAFCEPIFIPNTEYAFPEEDDGIMLSLVVYSNALKEVSLLILNPKTMKEVGSSIFRGRRKCYGNFSWTVGQFHRILE